MSCHPNLVGANSRRPAGTKPRKWPTQNVVRLLNVLVDNECLVLVLELVRGSDLLEVRSPLGSCHP